MRRGSEPKNLDGLYFMYKMMQYMIYVTSWLNKKTWFHYMIILTSYSNVNCHQLVTYKYLTVLTLWVPGVFLIICSRGPEIHLCFLQNFADKTTDGKIRFSISFLVSFELFFQELFFGHKECFIQPYLPRAFSRWKNARRASHVYIRGWPPRGVTQNTYIYVVGTQRVKE